MDCKLLRRAESEVRPFTFIDSTSTNIKFERMIIISMESWWSKYNTLRIILIPFPLKGKTSTWEVGALECIKEKRPKKFSEKHREWLQ
eukprot:scaffold19227_cov205-Skeletonema_dohrnii-CCMP3373.AAC.1